MMIVSQDKAPSRPSLRAVSSAVLAIMLFGAPVSAVQEVSPEAPKASQGKEAPSPADKKKKKATFHVGGKPIVARTAMPELSVPSRIIPQPFMPKGSIQPPKFSEAEKQAEGQDNNPSRDQNIAAAQETPDQTSGIVSQNLKRLDPSIVSAYRLDTTPLWQGHERSEIIRQLNLLGAPSQSPTLKYMAELLLRSPYDITNYTDEEEVYALLSARLSGLHRTADHGGYTALIRDLPGDWDFRGLVKERTISALLTSDYGSACKFAATENGDSNFWLRLKTLCHAINGDANSTDFHLGLLEELQAASPAYLQLIDQISLLAQQPNSEGEPFILSDPVNVDVLTAVAIELAAAKVTKINRNNIDPFALGLLLDYSGLDVSARQALLDHAGLNGWTTAKQLLRFAMLGDAGLSPKAGGEDGADDAPTPWPETIRQIKSALAEKDVEARLTQYVPLWHQALLGGYLTPVSGALVQMSPNAETILEAPELAAIVVRAAMLNGDLALAQAWTQKLRSSTAGADVDIDEALIALWPLLVTAGFDTDLHLSNNRYAIWWAAEGDRDDRFERASLYLGLIEALGITVDENIWRSLENGTGALSAAAASPVAWRALVKAEADADTSRLFASSVALLSGTGLDNASPAATIAVVGALYRQQHIYLARQLAIEALVLRGF